MRSAEAIAGLAALVGSIGIAAAIETLTVFGFGLFGITYAAKALLDNEKK